MVLLIYKGKTYQIDDGGFLVESTDWDEDFSEAVAKKLGMTIPIPERHRQIIRYIRETFEQTGRCLSIFETCRANLMKLSEFRALFPTGYLRGACKFAGLTYRKSYVKYSWAEVADRDARSTQNEKIYRVDVRGFPVDSSEWDENFAIHWAHHLKMTDGLSLNHWKIFLCLRKQYGETGSVATVLETCQMNQIDLDELERRFPEGNHRSAVKLAGLRVG